MNIVIVLYQIIYILLIILFFYCLLYICDRDFQQVVIMFMLITALFVCIASNIFMLFLLLHGG